MDEYMADPVEMFDHRHPGVLQHGLNQSMSSPGNQQIEDAVETAHLGNAFPAFILHQRDDLGRQLLFPGCLPQGQRQGPVAVTCLASPAQEDCIAGF